MENAIIHNRDIIMFGLQPWDISIGSNFKNMAVEMAKHNRILYVNRPLDRITAIKNHSDKTTIARKESIKKGINVLKEVMNNMWVLNPPVMIESINWMPAGAVYKRFNKRNNKKLAQQIHNACDKLHFEEPLLIIDNDFFNGLYLKEYLQVDRMIYYIRDYLLSQPYFVKHGTVAEPAIIAKADLVVANSEYLASYAKKYNSNSYYIGQGCEVENFVKKPEYIPADIRSIAKPMIGYCGALISSRLDIDLLYQIAKQRPGWNIVLVGPEDASFQRSELHSLKNVFFIGSKHANELPAYVHAFNVCLNPQIINQMTIGNYPRKVDEYLAAGKPVVATATEAMKEFESCTYLCNNASDYISVIEKILTDPDNEKLIDERISVATSHTWENSIAKLYNAINNVKSLLNGRPA